VLCEAGATDAHGFVVLTGTAVFFGELRKRNRRRILLNPASKFFNPRVFRHEGYGISTVTGADRLVLP